MKNMRKKNKIILFIDIILTVATVFSLFILEDSLLHQHDQSLYENSYIQKLIQEQKDVFSYIRDNIHDVVKRIGIQGTINLVHEAFKENSISLNQCHILLHLTGHQAYEFYNSDVNQMVQLKFGTICWEAYQHGVEAIVALEEPNPVKNLELLCKKWRQVDPKAGCYHGVGHSFLATSRNDIKIALSKCDLLIPTYDDSIPNCYRGAFSEFGNRVLNYDGDTGKHYEGTSTVEFKYRYPLIFCQELDERYRQSCYSQLTKIIFQSEIGKAIQDCNIEQYNDEAKLICIRALGLLYAEGMLSNNETIIAPIELSALTDDYRRAFISSAKVVFFTFLNEGTKKDSSSFCNSLQLEKDQLFCRDIYKES